MKVHGVSRNLENPIFVYLKKHKCPYCSQLLERVKVSKIVRAGSAEAANFDFSMPGGGYMRGNIKFIWTEFRCPECGRQFKIDELKKMGG